VQSQLLLTAAVRNQCSERQLSADCVEKLRISDVMIFRREPEIGKSQVISAMRRSELPHERQKTNLAELLASKSWSRRTGKNFTDFAKNGVFQHNPPFLTNHLHSLPAQCQAAEACLNPASRHHSKPGQPLPSQTPKG